MKYQPEAGGPLDKFRLLYSVATDERASRSHVAVLGVILWRFNKAHGCCWPSIESIAEDAGLDTRTVQRGLDSLENWNYLHTVRQRGKLNRYVPHFQAQRRPASNGTHAGGQDSRGRHPRPEGTTSTSKRDGVHAVSPPAWAPPEYLNEPIPEKGKEKHKSDFSSLGNRGTGEGHRTSESAPAVGATPSWSPEKRANLRLQVLEARLANGLQDAAELDERQSVLDIYLREVEQAGGVPDPELKERILTGESR
jgi:hypothetical protein